MTSNIVPLDPIPKFVVEYGEAGLIMEFLKSLDCDSDVVISSDGALLDTLVVIRLGNVGFSCSTPEGVGMRLIGWRDPTIACPCPEPTIHVDWLEMSPITALVLEVTFPTARVDRRHIISGHDLLEDLVLSRGVEGDEVHAAISAKVPPVEPVPVLEFMPGFSPGKEVIVVPKLHVSLPFHAFFDVWSVEKWFTIWTNSCWFLCQGAGQ